jgi:hypothetical protein
MRFYMSVDKLSTDMYATSARLQPEYSASGAQSHDILGIRRQPRKTSSRLPRQVERFSDRLIQRLSD